MPCLMPSLAHSTVFRFNVRGSRVGLMLTRDHFQEMTLVQMHRRLSEQLKMSLLYFLEKSLVWCAPHQDLIYIKKNLKAASVKGQISKFSWKGGEVLSPNHFFPHMHCSLISGKNPVDSRVILIEFQGVTCSQEKKAND